MQVIQSGVAADMLYELREEKRSLEAEIKTIEERMSELEQQLLGSLDDQGSTMTRGRSASASITESEIAIITDLDALHEYMSENDALYLKQNRLATAAIMELIKAGEVIPGIDIVSKRKISLRKLSN